MIAAIVALLVSAVLANPLCVHPDRSLSKNGMYNPAFRFSIELGGECHMKQFVQGPIIGKGHYGIVKQAVHRATGKVVALKFLEGINPSKFTNHRNEECNQHAAQSPLLVKHFCTMMHDDQVVFVMDFLEGMSLREYFQKKNTLTGEQLQYYVAQMLVALEVLHEKGIIFGSLTSANVMLLKDGSMQLIDFGASMRILPGEEPEAKPTFVEYKARPHRWKNFAHDYYSLGVLVYELAYANKSSKWADPKIVLKHKCQKILDQKICDLIGRMYTQDYANIWGTTKRTQALLKKHPWFGTIDWNWINDYAKGNLSMDVDQQQADYKQYTEYDQYEQDQLYYDDGYDYEYGGPVCDYSENYVVDGYDYRKTAAPVQTYEYY